MFKVGDKVKKGNGKTIWTVTTVRMLNTPWTSPSGKVVTHVIGIKSDKIDTCSYDHKLTLVS